MDWYTETSWLIWYRSGARTTPANLAPATVAGAVAAAKAQIAGALRAGGLQVPATVDDAALLLLHGNLSFLSFPPGVLLADPDERQSLADSTARQLKDLAQGRWVPEGVVPVEGVVSPNVGAVAVVPDRSRLQDVFLAGTLGPREW